MEINKRVSHAPTLTNLRMWSGFIQVFENLLSAAFYVVRKQSHIFETFMLMDELNLISLCRECNHFKQIYSFL